MKCQPSLKQIPYGKSRMRGSAFIGRLQNDYRTSNDASDFAQQAWQIIGVV
jgi:hypothetical protein